uniref:SpoVT-AbrB domain-containing protein n=1 Tax=uncultured Thiotrichaceae bacterium TaxID=298394 RepID=A0A6S6TMX3_9GAMM|nr:MAG: Unknown protein [uncultured Thiotrichaceae bacterium]
MQPTLTRVFTSGNSQAIRLPKQFQMDTKEVFIRRSGNDLIISPHPDSWDGFMQGCEGFSEDFSIDRDALPEDSARWGFE